ncbi:MAG TPA: hypothetical protein VH595_15895 [Verrucomicrobiae bacterium]|nr:hypothetical protein [Verrucomicrobiae bacterium]
MKVCGQVLTGDHKTYYATDGGFGFRFELAKSEKLNPGDEIEVVGLVDLGGASPALREAVIRKTGHAPLPAPQPFSFNQTNKVRDATWCRTDGLLLDVKENGTGRDLEVQNGVRVFTAKVRGDDRFAEKWKAGSLLRACLNNHVHRIKPVCAA